MLILLNILLYEDRKYENGLDQSGRACYEILKPREKELDCEILIFLRRLVYYEPDIGTGPSVQFPVINNLIL